MRVKKLAQRASTSFDVYPCLLQIKQLSNKIDFPKIFQVDFTIEIEMAFFKWRNSNNSD